MQNASTALPPPLSRALPPDEIPASTPKDNAASPGGRRNKGLFAGLLGIDGAPSRGTQRRAGGAGDKAGADDGGGFVVMIGEHGGKSSRCGFL